MDSIDLAPLIVTASIADVVYTDNCESINVSLEVSLEEYSLKNNSKIQLCQFISRDIDTKERAQPSFGTIPIKIDQTLVKKSCSPSRKYSCSFFDSNTAKEISIFKSSDNTKILSIDVSKLNGKFYFGSFYFI